jgi:circadian clock protein KaiC
VSHATRFQHVPGSSRLAQEARERADTLDRQQRDERRRQELARKRRALRVKIQSLQAEFAAEEEEMRVAIRENLAREKQLETDRDDMAHDRGVGRRKNRDSGKKRVAGGGR